MQGDVAAVTLFVIVDAVLSDIRGAILEGGEHFSLPDRESPALLAYKQWLERLA
jgi:hypothetical protein